MYLYIFFFALSYCGILVTSVFNICKHIMNIILKMYSINVTQTKNNLKRDTIIYTLKYFLYSCMLKMKTTIILTWYFSGGPTVSTNTSQIFTPLSKTRCIKPMAALCEISFKEHFCLFKII